MPEKRMLPSFMGTAYDHISEATGTATGTGRLCDLLRLAKVAVAKSDQFTLRLA